MRLKTFQLAEVEAEKEAEAAEEAAEVEEPEEPAEVLDPEKESEKKETAETERRIASLQENLDEADVTSEYGIKAPELHELLEGKKASLFKPEINVIRNVL